MKMNPWLRIRHHAGIRIVMREASSRLGNKPGSCGSSFRVVVQPQTSNIVPGKKWFVVEVFSPPRFAKVVQDAGYSAWSH